jgi:DNA replicative helicase MCM subunit Mcm2 (Cdc46/Mcm family)
MLSVEKIISNKILKKKFGNKSKKKILEDRTIFCFNDMHKYLNSIIEDIFEVLENKNEYCSKEDFSESFKEKFSILASLNPNALDKILKSYKEKSYLNTNLLSNFDLIFWNNNEFNRLKYLDKKLAQGELNLYDKTVKKSENFPEWKKISFEMLKKYIYFVSKTIYPILNKSASEILKNAYLHMRYFFKKKNDNLKKFPFLVSIRHLESLIKISASITKMKLSGKIDVEEALESVRLFQKRFYFQK